MNKLKTPIDDIVGELKMFKVMKIETLSSKLNLPIKSCEKLINILEKNKIVKITFQGIHQIVEYIEIIKLEKNNKLNIIKDKFLEKSKQNKLNNFQIETLWVKFFNENEEGFKKKFLENEKEENWNIYKKTYLKLT